MKKGQVFGKLITELTPYEKLLRLPKEIEYKPRMCKIPLEYSFDIHFYSKFNDDCCIEYNHWSEYSDTYDTADEMHWHGTFEECINKAYEYFNSKGLLIEDENLYEY